jgi:hypothetical protein
MSRTAKRSEVLATCGSSLNSHEMLVPRDHPYRFDGESSWPKARMTPYTSTSARQGLAVGLDREIFELPALLGNHRERAARGVYVHADVPFHRYLLLLGIVDSATQGCPTKPGGTNLPDLGDLRCCSQTPYSYYA